MNITGNGKEKTDNIISKRGKRMNLSVFRYILAYVYASLILTFFIFVLASPIIFLLFMIDSGLTIEFLRSITIGVFLIFSISFLFKGWYE